MKAKTDTIKQTSNLMRGLLTVPKVELEAQERAWKKRKGRPRRKAKG
jgi:hypothetical protein